MVSKLIILRDNFLPYVFLLLLSVAFIAKDANAKSPPPGISSLSKANVLFVLDIGEAMIYQNNIMDNYYPTNYSPSQIAFDKDNNLISTHNGNKISVINQSNGTQKHRFNGTGATDSDGSFSVGSHGDMIRDKNGYIYTTDQKYGSNTTNINHEFSIVKLDKNLNEVSRVVVSLERAGLWRHNSTLDRSVFEVNQHNVPTYAPYIRGLALNKDEDLLFATQLGKILVFNSSDLSRATSEEANWASINDANKIAIDGLDQVYITNFNQEIKVYSKTAVLIRSKNVGGYISHIALEPGFKSVTYDNWVNEPIPLPSECNSSHNLDFYDVDNNVVNITYLNGQPQNIPTNGSGNPINLYNSQYVVTFDGGGNPIPDNRVPVTVPTYDCTQKYKLVNKPYTVNEADNPIIFLSIGSKPFGFIDDIESVQSNGSSGSYMVYPAIFSSGGAIQRHRIFTPSFDYVASFNFSLIEQQRWDYRQIWPFIDFSDTAAHDWFMKWALSDMAFNKNDDKIYISTATGHIMDLEGNLFIEGTNYIDIVRNVLSELVSSSQYIENSNFGLLLAHERLTTRLSVPISKGGGKEIYDLMQNSPLVYTRNSTVEADPKLPTWGMTSDGGLDDEFNEDFYGDLLTDYFTNPASYGSNDLDLNSSCKDTIVIILTNRPFVNATGSSITSGIYSDLYTNYGVRTGLVGLGHAVDGIDNVVYNPLISGPWNEISTAGNTAPESPIIANSELGITSNISRLLSTINETFFTFSAPTIVSDRDAGNFLLQSTFRYKPNNQWEGHLRRYDLNPDGSIASLAWDAGELLNARAASTRKVYGANDIMGPTPHWSYIDRNFKVFLNRFLSLEGNDAIDELNEATELIRFIMGFDEYDEYPDSLTPGVDYAPLVGERWKLGDMFYSRPIFVGPPSASHSFKSAPYTEENYRARKDYKTFAETHKNRKKVIYAATNHGLIHAFDAATGEELWAWFPFNSFKHLLEIKSNVTGQSNAFYGFDSTPVVKDIYVDHGGGGWKTILIAGQGRGGKGYFILDITDPDNPKRYGGYENYPANKNVVQHKWNVDNHPYDEAQAGELSSTNDTWSQPIILATPFKPWHWRTEIFYDYEILITSGLGSNTNTGIDPSIMYLDNDARFGLKKSIILPDKTTNNIYSSLPATVSAVGTDTTTSYTNAGYSLYITDLEGKLWKITNNIEDTSYSDSNGRYREQNELVTHHKQIFDAESTLSNNRMNYFKTGLLLQEDDRLLNVFGTGDILNMEEINGSFQNYIYGIIDNEYPSINKTTSDIKTISDLQDVTQICPQTAANGWYYRLGNSEKVTAPVTTYKNSAFASVFVPNASACTAGSAKLIQINTRYCTANPPEGGVTTETVTEHDLGTGIPTQATTFNGNVYVGVSGVAASPDPTNPSTIAIQSIVTDSTPVVRIDSWWEDF